VIKLLNVHIHVRVHSPSRMSTIYIKYYDSLNRYHNPYLVLRIKNAILSVYVYSLTSTDCSCLFPIYMLGYNVNVKSPHSYSENPIHNL
jgi:hypothetical protein